MVPSGEKKNKESAFFRRLHSESYEDLTALVSDNNRCLNRVCQITQKYYVFESILVHSIYGTRLLKLKTTKVLNNVNMVTT